MKIIKHDSKKINLRKFLVFRAEKCDQGNVRPTLKFVTNHEEVWGTLSQA